MTCHVSKHGKLGKFSIARCDGPKHMVMHALTRALVQLTWRLRKGISSQAWGLGFIIDAKDALMPDPWEVRKEG